MIVHIELRAEGAAGDRVSDAALVLEYIVVIWAPIDVAKAAVVCVFENESCHLFLTWW